MSDTILSGRWVITYLSETRAKTIKRDTSISPSTIDSVNTLYTALQDLFDESTQMDDGVPMSAQTPTEYTIGIIDAGDTDPWFIDRTSIEYLSGGALKSSSWTRSLTNTGIVRLTVNNASIDNTDLGDTISDGTSTGTLLDWKGTGAGSILWVRPASLDSANNFDSGGTLTVNSHTATYSAGTPASGESIWSNIYSLGTLVSGTHLYIYQNDIKLAKYKDSANDWWGDGHIDILVTVKEVGTEIDGGNLTVLARKYTTLYDHYVIDASTGRNPVPLAAFSDRNNQTLEATVSGYSGITFDFGATSQDLGDGSGPHPYDVTIDCGGHTVSELYEYLKYVTRRSSAATLNGVSGEYYAAVGSIRLDYTSETSGPFVEGNAITSSAGGSGYITSLIDNGTTGTLVIRNSHGTFADTNTLTSSGTTATVNGTPEEISPSKQSPFGTFAGGIFFGARGVFITNMAGADANSYQLTDSTGATRTPPTTVSTTITVKDLSTGSVIENAIVLVWVTDSSNYFYHASVSITGSGTTATVTQTGHGLTNGDFVIIEGVTNDDDYNGVFEITKIDDNQYSYTTSETLDVSPATGTPVATFALISDTTDVNGRVSDVRSLSSDQPIVGWVRKSSGSPYYQQGAISGTVDADTGFSVTIQLARDE